MPFDGPAAQIETILSCVSVRPEPPPRPATPLISTTEICRLVLEAHQRGVLQATARVAGRFRWSPAMEATTEQAVNWLEAAQWSLGVKKPISRTYYCAAGYVRHSTGLFENDKVPETMAFHTESPEEFMRLVNWHDAIVVCRDKTVAGNLLRSFIAAVQMVAHGEAKRFDLPVSGS